MGENLEINALQDVPGKHCRPKTENKCFTYTRKSCKPTSKQFSYNFT